MTAVNARPGDLDIKVYNEDGYLIAQDMLDDNVPIVQFRNSYTQQITVRVINSSTARAADYRGVIE